MKEVIFKQKSFSASNKYTYLRGIKYNKLSTCPYCGICVDANVVDYYSFKITDGYIVDIAYKCISCDNIFHVSYENVTQNDLFNTFSTYPHYKDRDFSEQIINVSERFVKLYNQANKAEYDGNYELAGCGYRNALEVLIKDFAINVLNEDKNIVSKKHLYKAIEDYLSDVDMSNCADVVRILGNDNTHYERDYDNIDFDVLKKYMDIFIQMIDVKIQIANPPVSRNKED